MRGLLILWQTFFRDEFSQSFRNSKPKSRTSNIMIRNKEFVLPIKQVSYCADCRRSSYLRSGTTCFPHNWLVTLICLQKGSKLHICYCLVSTNVLLGDYEHPCLPLNSVATENTQILGAALKTNSGSSFRAWRFLPEHGYGLHGILPIDCCQPYSRRF